MIPLLLLGFILIAPDVFGQQFCSRLSNGSLICDGDRGPAMVSPLGRNGVIIDSDRRDSYEEEQRARRAEEARRDEERRRDILYGDWPSRSDRSRSRDYGEYGR